MMYNNKLVAVIEKDGKILREQGNDVFMNYDSEYVILFKNLDYKRAVKIGIEIDGEDVLNGNLLVLRPKQDERLKGFITNGNVVRNRFKFIEKTQEISDYRGDRIEDGIINITFSFEKMFSNASEICDWPKQKSYPNRPMIPEIKPFWPYNPMDIQYKSFYNYTTSDSNDNVLCSCNSNNMPSSGITVKGSQTNQKFKNTYCYSWESTVHNMCFVLKGKTQLKHVVKPLFVCSKVLCETCGKVSRSNAKFCSRCGTSLV